MKHLLVLMLVAFAMVGCSKKTTTSKAVKTIPLNIEDLNKVMAGQSLTCADGKCPYAVARLFIVNFEDAANSMNCSGTLVGDRMLLTNSHCLESNKSPLKSCEGFYAVFRTENETIEIARCAKIHFRNPLRSRNRQDLLNRDYALIELDRTVSAKPIGVEPNGFVPGESVSPYVVDHQDAYNARIVKLNCRVSPISHNGRDLQLDNCPAIPGNSGAGILNVRNRVAGVLYAAQETAVDHNTEYNLRIAAPTISAGFSMRQILKDLAPWLERPIY